MSKRSSQSRLRKALRKIVTAQMATAKFDQKKDEQGNLICSICGDSIISIEGWELGCNADPINDGRCCDACDHEVVLPTRIRRSKVGLWNGQKITDEDVILLRKYFPVVTVE